MRIGLDIDDVLADSTRPLIAYVKEERGAAPEWNKFSSFYLNEVLGCTREEALAVIERFWKSPHSDRITPTADSVYAVKLLANSHELVAVTSRHEGLSKNTEAFLSTNFGKDITEIFYLYDALRRNKFASKGSICKEMEVDCLIEDNYDNALNCAEAGIPAILFGTPWNRRRPPHPLIRRADGWIEVLRIIRSRKFF
jgi:uncharacterized HAD superfamily protein